MAAERAYLPRWAIRVQYDGVDDAEIQNSDDQRCCRGSSVILQVSRVVVDRMSRSISLPGQHHLVEKPS